jgi:CheY-like chemotaxis protein
MKDRAGKTILVIEDEPDVTIYLSTILHDNGYKVETAGNGIEAMSKIRTVKPDLISLDISLPAKTGVNIYCELKEDPQLSSIPVIIVTGIERDFKSYIHSQKNLPPPDGFISKPFIITEFLKVIASVLIKKPVEQIQSGHHE